MSILTNTPTKLIALAIFAGVAVALIGCDGCDDKKKKPALSLPFFDNFDRPDIGIGYWTGRPGRWKIKYNATTKQGRICGDQARTNHLFLQGRLPNNVVVELDAWGLDPAGDLKVELFSDGRYNKTGYVLVQGGWVNRHSIIDRLGEHNNKTRSKRSAVRGQPLVVRNQKYHWKIIRAGGILKWYVDGKLYLKYEDKMPLKNPNHAYFAFANWVAKTCFDNLRIDRYQPPTAANTAPTRTQTPTPTPPPVAVPRREATPAPAVQRLPRVVPVRRPPLRMLKQRKGPVLMRSLRNIHKPLNVHMLQPKLQRRKIRYLMPRRLAAPRPRNP